MTTTSAGTILVVDDEPHMRELLCEFLEPEGYTIITAEDGATAWQLMNGTDTRFDVLVTDRNMPNLNGMELLGKVKQDERFRSLPVIFQTACATRDEVVEGLNAGVYYYLAKPYDRKILIALVKSAVEDAQRQNVLQEEVCKLGQALSMMRGCQFQYRTLAETRSLVPLLSRLSCDPGRVVYGLSELLINAVEHGNIGITYEEKGPLVTAGTWEHEVERRVNLLENRDKYVLVELMCEPEQTTFTITDMGNGFAPEKFLEFDPARAMDVHGRGIALSRMMSFDHLEYRGRGNQVVAVVRKCD